MASPPSALAAGRARFGDRFLVPLNIAFIIWYAVFSLSLIVPVALMVLVRHRGWGAGRFQTGIRRFIQLYGRCVIWLSWPLVRISIENRSAAQGVEPCIYILNHRSFMDVFFCGFLPGFQTVIAIKGWPFRLPVYNIFMRLAGYLNVEDKDLRAVANKVARILRSGACMLFFPEGHRTRTGRLLPMRKGAFRFAAENRVPIVPVALEGTEYLGGYKSRLFVPCRVRMRFFPPILAEGRSFTAIRDLQRKVENLYKREVSEQ